MIDGGKAISILVIVTFVLFIGWGKTSTGSRTLRGLLGEPSLPKQSPKQSSKQSSKQVPKKRGSNTTAKKPAAKVTGKKPVSRQ